MRVKLIGGVFDGQNAEWDGVERVLRVHRPRQAGSVWDHAPRPESMACSVERVQYGFEVYTVRTVNVDGEQLYFAAPQTWPDLRAFKELLRTD